MPFNHPVNHVVDPLSTTLPIRLSREVEEALRSGSPLVALESNVIAHGLRRPLNLESAHEVEDVLRCAGVTPATTAVLDGEIVVGLTVGELERVGRADLGKVSSRSLGVYVARRRSGATTIAATMMIAHLVGIRTVASAGLGGVHRGVGETWDISSDLIQLTRSNVILVSAGAKSILDLPKTLEFLETHCVPVVAFRSDDFPAFYCRSSGLRCPARIDDPHELAQAARLHWSLQGQGSVLVTHPIPAADALDTVLVEAALEEALASARERGVRGADVTKDLMTAVDRATGGRAGVANAVVLRNTAAAAAEIAAAWAGIDPRRAASLHPSPQRPIGQPALEPAQQSLGAAHAD